MPPRPLPPKRRSEGESSRAQKKGKEPEYNTFDECMDGGVEAEERGERYRDGEKAQRAYEQAAELYAQALAKDETSFDAAYNLGRVMYRLAGEFYLPPSSLDVWTGAMMLFKRALGSTQDPSLKNDAAYSLADVVEEYQGERARQQAMELRENASKLLSPVLQANFMFAMHKQENQDAEAASEAAGEAEMDVDKAETTEATTDDMAVDTDAATPAPAPGEPGFKPAGSTPTGDSLADVVLLMADLGITLWNYFSPQQMPPDSQQEAIAGILDTSRQFVPPTRQAEIDLMETKMLLQLDSNMWDLVKGQVAPGSGPDTSLEKAAVAIERILTSLDASPSDDSSTRADILTTLADTEMNAAARLMFLFPRAQDAAPLATRAWAQLSAAARHLTQAAGLPVSASTPKEFKPSVYLGLMRSTLLRARLAPVNATAAANAQKLLDNVAAYATKAADAAGWKLPKLPRANDPQPNPFFSEPLVPPFPQGWDMEMLARDIQLLMLRVVYFVSTGMFAGVDVDSYEAAGKAVVEGIQSVKNGPRRLMPRDLERFLSDIEEEEGALSEGEAAWWADMKRRIEAGVPPEEHREAAPQEFAPAVAEAIKNSAGEGEVSTAPAS
jgi:tetratricopeptide (TPR) repeat protein